MKRLPDIVGLCWVLTLLLAITIPAWGHTQFPYVLKAAFSVTLLLTVGVTVWLSLTYKWKS